MRRMLESENTDGYEKSEILEKYLQNDLTRAKDLAPKYLDHKNSSVRLKAGVIVFQTGDKEHSRTVLGDALENGEVNWSSKQAIEVLLKDGSPASRAQAARIFKNKQLHHGGTKPYDSFRVEIARLCVDAGMKEPYSYYLKQLDNQKVAFTSTNGETAYAQVLAREIVQTIAPNDPVIKEIAKKHAEDSDQIPYLKKWLQAKIAGQ